MTTIPRYRKRLYYPAGLISLILLPTLCIWFLDKNKAFNKPSAIEINWWNEEWKKHNLDEYPYMVHPERKFVDINLTENDKENKIKLAFAHLEIRRLISTNDTINAIHFHFENNAKYWTLIRALDICIIEKAKTYVPKGSDLWVFNFVPRPKHKIEDEFISVCGNSMLMDNISVFKSTEEIEEEKKERKKYIIETAKRYSVSIILFILMTVMAFKQFYKKRSQISRPRL